MLTSIAKEAQERRWQQSMLSLFRSLSCKEIVAKAHLHSNRARSKRELGREDCQPAPGAGWWVGAPATTPTEELYVQLCPDRLWALVPSRILAHVHYVRLSKYLRFTLTAPEVAGGPLKRGKP